MAVETRPKASLERTLGLGGGIALAIGSVAGAGILFLPSTIVGLAGRDALVVWAVATALCVPLLFVFTELVREVPDGSGIEGFVARGFGEHAAACVPLLFLSVYYPGLAAASLVAGGYLESAIGGGRPVRLAGALLVIGGSLLTNLVGARGGARLQALVTWTLLGTALALFGLTVPEARGSYDAVAPTLDHLDPLLGAIVVAFWAYAGFENMTFVAGEMRNPRRDYLVATLVALFSYGILAALLTANVAAIIPAAELDELAGVAQLAHHVVVPSVGVAVITVLALALVQAGVTSWLWGISRLLFSAARDGRLHRSLAVLDRRGIPRRAVLVLALPGAALTSLASIFPGLVLKLVVAVSATFMFLYLLVLASYLRSPRSPRRRALAWALLAVMGAILVTRGWYFLYPAGVAALAFVVSVLRRPRVASRQPSSARM
jgi:amino acid efflux transporter